MTFLCKSLTSLAKLYKKIIDYFPNFIIFLNYPLYQLKIYKNFANAVQFFKLQQKFKSQFTYNNYSWYDLCTFLFFKYGRYLIRVKSLRMPDILPGDKKHIKIAFNVFQDSKKEFINSVCLFVHALIYLNILGSFRSLSTLKMLSTGFSALYEKRVAFITNVLKKFHFILCMRKNQLLRILKIFRDFRCR